jgi:parvulin-like peptidyl-prolyl isomerase
MKRKTTRKTAGRLTLGSVLVWGALWSGLTAAQTTEQTTAQAAARTEAPMTPTMPATPAVTEVDVFARVDGKVITVRDFQSALAAGMRQKFYHGRPREGELARFSREVGEKLVMQLLLGAEAERRGIEPDRTAIDKQIEEYDRRYAASEQWQRSRENVLKRLVGELERRSRLERLEAQVKAVAVPAEDEALAYYRSRPELFTEPERVRLSLILLKVQPGAAGKVWEAAFAEAGRLHERLVKGADFAEVARLHSGDPSAAKGGDLGYLHRGMLPAEIEKQFVDGLQTGQISKPARVLEGIAIVRLDERRPPLLREYGLVARSAQDLLQRERGEQAWARLTADLRAAAVVQLDESRYPKAAH